MLTITGLRLRPTSAPQTRLVTRPIRTTVLVGCLLIALQLPMQAIPAFARKYQLPCEQCHSMIPRLNNFGYAFYRAGFRLPGPNKPLTLANSTDVLTYFNGAHTNPGHSDSVTDDTADVKFSGTLSTNISANVEYDLSVRRGVNSSLSEVWAQYNSAAKGTYWSLRVGQLLVLDGYNLLGDRNLSITDPQLLDAFGALGGNNGNLSLNGLERGIEVGYNSGRFNTRFSLLYGVDATGDPNNEPRFNDYLMQAEYFLDQDGSAIQVFAYVGRTPIDGSGFADNLQRGGIFATWGHTLKAGDAGVPKVRIELNGGLLWGEDQVSAGTGRRQDSVGTVFEATLYLRNRTGIFARYDGVRLGNAGGTPTTDAGTVGISHRFTRFMTGQLELREQRAPYNATILGTVGLYF